MELENKLDALSSKIEQQKSTIQTEEATKTAFIMPFIQNVLGYDVFNPYEVTPEFTADVGTKKGEKVDYAILKDGEVQILFECKKIDDPLDVGSASQLYRYFSVTTARIAVLTNGQVYKFFTDLDAPNRMDERPFLVLDLLDIDSNVIPELEKLTKPAFDLESVLSAAGELKYVSLIKRAIADEFAKSSDDFSRLLTCKVYDGTITQRVREQFAPLIAKSLRQFLNDRVNERLKTAISANASKQDDAPEAVENDCENEKDDVITTQEELEAFNIVKAILRQNIDVKRVVARDTLSYFGILLDDNRNKTICRLHFNRKQKYIGIFDKDKKEVRHPIENLNEIFNFAEGLKGTISLYE